MEVFTVLTLIGFLPPIQELHHWLKYLGLHISVTKFGVNDGFNLLIP